MRRAFVLSSLMALGVVALAGCGSDAGIASPSPGPSPTQPPADPFTVSIVPRTAPGNIVFYPMFGSQVGTLAAVVLDAQRSPAGTLAGGWSSSPASGVVGLSQNGLSAQVTAAGAGEATITFGDNSGPSGTFVVRSAPKFSADTNIDGTTNTESAGCLDTTPAGTTSICSDATDIGLGQRTFSFVLISTAAGTPPRVSVSGTFQDGGVGGFTISNAPTIDAGGTFLASGQINAVYIRPGVFAPARAAIPITVREDWHITAAGSDSFTGTATVLITPSGNLCGSRQNIVCSGTVAITRTILTARRR